MQKSIQERFAILDNTIKSDDFLANKGLGNEVGYYIFDYHSKHEFLVREHVKGLINKNHPDSDGYELQEFNLYKIMMDLIDERGYFDKIVQMEEKHDIQFVASRVSRLLKMEEFDDAQMYFIKYIGERVNEKSVVLLTGIGEIYPIIRAHSVLNKMNLVYNKRPVIMMYPGKYDRLKLDILETNRATNYYRAFRIE